jgi:endonuclease/exonuclease/phosphatase family metal-dependent hydrolase
VNALVSAETLTPGISIVTWNAKGGSGALAELIAALRAGSLTEGRPVHHFAFLLQEVVRVGPTVPAEMPAGGASARTVGAPTEPSRDIRSVAARAGLYLFYAPSMRNGAEFQEDRGNAILSTLPLSDLVAFELPLERQRRVVLSARISVPVGTGEHSGLKLVVLHLDNTSSGARFWRSFGAGRVRQSRAVLESLEGHGPIVLGGDLNTWFGEASEQAIVMLRSRFALPSRIPDVNTYRPPYGFPKRQTDYLLFGLPPGWVGSYETARDWYGSDHAPLIGWIEPPGRGAVAAPPE